MKRALPTSLCLTLLVVFSLLIGACSPATPVAEPTTPPTEEEVAQEEEHGEEMGEHVDEHEPEEHMAGEHDVPEDAAAIENPIEATDESIATGRELYATNCATCHGETGEGDGPAAASLDPSPSDLHEDHVQGLTDGALFYIISHGRPETAMPAWENTLDVEQRWHVVNFLRTFQEE